MQELLKPILYAVASLIILYMAYNALKATVAIFVYVVITLLAATPFLVLMTGVVLAIYYQKPEHGALEIFGYNIGGKYSFIVIIISLLASALLFWFFLKHKIFKKIYRKINPGPSPSESIKVDKTHLTSKS